VGPQVRTAVELDVVVEGALLRVTIDRPAQRNALSREVLRSLERAFTEHAANERLKLAVLSGAGDKSFAAGGDLKDLATIRTREGASEMAEQAKAALDRIRAFPVPVLAALNGDAMGGGAELAVACDFRVAAAHARIGFVQGRLNISTAWGGGIDLARLVGPSVALRILCSSELLAPGRAQDLGLVDAVAGADQSLAEAVGAFAAPILEQAPQVLRAFKAVTRASRQGASRSELEALETRLFAATWVHEDHWKAADGLLSKSQGRRELELGSE
jgi:enoyl-CoA hydratase